MHLEGIDSLVELQALVGRADYAVLSMCENNQPYAVPLNAAYDGEYFYLHSGHFGHKINILQNNVKVFLNFVLDASFFQPKGSGPCKSSMQFKSIAVSGTAEVLGADSPLEQRRAGLLCLLRRYGLDEQMDDKVLAQTTVIKVKPESISLRSKHKAGE